VMLTSSLIPICNLRTPYLREVKGAPFGRLAREPGQFVDEAQFGARVD
jgi:hypothetical protein